MGIQKIDHIAIAVHSISETLKFFHDILGLPLVQIEEVAKEQVKVAFLPVGENYLELIEPMSSGGSIAKFLKKKGEGLHHLAFKISNMEKTITSLKEKGVAFVGEAPRKGANNKEIAFLHPKDTHGILIEFCKEIN